MYDERLGKIHFWMTFIGFNATFGPMHLLGLGDAAPGADYAEQFAGWNLFISIASFFVGLNALVFVYNMVSSWRGGPRAEANPWRALTLGGRSPARRRSSSFDNRAHGRGGPYEYGVPGAVHGVFRKPGEVRPAPAGTVVTAPKKE